MKVSFDGMRRSATRDMNELCNIIATILDENTYQKVDDDLKEELILKFNNAAFSVDCFNCLFDNDVKDDLNDLSEELSVCRLDN